MPIRHKKILILFSGGIDSTALINFYKDLNYAIKCLHFQYNQDSAMSEMDSVSKICGYYDVPFTTLSLNFLLQKRYDEYIGRNALFIIISLSSKFSEDYNKIAIGINNSSPYYDCSELFIKNIQSIVDGYYAGTKVIEAPFVNSSKYDVIKYCISNKVPIDLTYSCLKKNYPACGECEACRDRRLINEVRPIM